MLELQLTGGDVCKFAVKEVQESLKGSSSILNKEVQESYERAAFKYERFSMIFAN